MRSAGDTDSTAAKASDDQLAARRAFRAKHPRAPRERGRGRDAADLPGIDPSLGTGLIENIICEPEDDSHDGRSVCADDVLDAFSAGDRENATLTVNPTCPSQPERSADDELDEIEVQLRRHTARRTAQPSAVGPRGSADLTSDVALIRAPRRPTPDVRPKRDWRTPIGLRSAAILAAALIAACAAIIAQPSSPGQRRPATSSHRSLGVTGRTAAPEKQLTAAAYLRAFVAIDNEKTAAADAAKKQRRTRLERAHRRDHHLARTKTVAQRPVSVDTTRPSIAATSTVAATSQPTAEGASVSSSAAKPSGQHAHSAAPAGPTGGIGSISGGCTPQC